MFQCKHTGFSLIELLIVMAIVAILTCIAYPSYQAHLQKAYRTHAKTLLHQFAHTLHNHYSYNQRYERKIIAPLIEKENQTNRHTIFAIQTLTTHHFTLTATAKSEHSRSCKTLSLDEVGRMNPYACWR